jgi:uncharacterized protein YcbK (DUF882 family)
MSRSRRQLLQAGGLAACWAAGAGFMARRAWSEVPSGGPESPSDASPPQAAAPAAAQHLPANRRISFTNLHTQEKLDVEFFSNDAYVPAAFEQIEHLLRDYRNGEVHAIDPALIDYAHAVATALGAEPDFSLISGYRSAQTNEQLRARSSGVAQHSLHMQGRAMDVRLAGVDCAALAARAQSLARGGVGYYRASDFVHLDTGAYRTWRG